MDCGKQRFLIGRPSIAGFDIFEKPSIGGFDSVLKKKNLNTHAWIFTEYLKINFEVLTDTELARNKCGTPN